MNENLVNKLKSTSDSKTAAGRLFVLEVSASRIVMFRHMLPRTSITW